MEFVSLLLFLYENPVFPYFLLTFLVCPDWFQLLFGKFHPKFYILKVQLSFQSLRLINFVWGSPHELMDFKIKLLAYMCFEEIWSEPFLKFLPGRNQIEDALEKSLGWELRTKLVYVTFICQIVISQVTCCWDMEISAAQNIFPQSFMRYTEQRLRNKI